MPGITGRAAASAAAAPAAAGQPAAAAAGAAAEASEVRGAGQALLPSTNPPKMLAGVKLDVMFKYKIIWCLSYKISASCLDLGQRKLPD